jgi:hypothetical protein
MTSLTSERSTPHAWQAEAFNPVPESENRIHSDETATAYGFRGALVPGVVVSAYLLHPAAEAWSRDWLECGKAKVVVHSPVYDAEKFDVKVIAASDRHYEAVLVDERGTECATAEASLEEAPAAAPTRRQDALFPHDGQRALATREAMEGLRETGLYAMAARWSEDAEMTSYLRDASGLAEVFRKERLANPAFLLGMTNWVLGRNVKMSPWLHLQTESQHYAAVSLDTELVVEAAIVDLFEKKGHEFVDVEVGVFQRSDDAAIASIKLRAIYKLRAP